MNEYRYQLTRELGMLDHIGTLGWLMLNPSTADQTRDDPTTRKVTGFTKRAGYGAWCIANLYPMRATKPAALHAADEARRRGQPASQADEAIEWLCLNSSAVVLAWGSHGARCLPRVREVARIAVDSGRPLYAILGPTRSGHPPHPLTAAYDRGLVPVDDWARHVADGGAL